MVFRVQPKRRPYGRGAAVKALRFFFLCLGLMSAGCAHEITLAWQDTSRDEKGFKIYRLAGREKQMIAIVDANVTSFVDRGAPAGACYVVTAFNDAGESEPTNLACGR